MSAEWEIQKAIFDKLEVDLAVPVYDFVPQEGAESTYVTLGDDTFSPFNTDGRKGFEGLLNIHVWDISNGRKDCKLLQGSIYDSLDRAEFTITGYNPVGIDFQSSQTILDPDGVTYHGIQRFKFTIMEQ